MSDRQSHLLCTALSFLSLDKVIYNKESPDHSNFVPVLL